MRLALLAMLLLSGSALGFAGCLEGGVTLLTAEEARGTADDAAEAWSEDARLVGASGMEFGPEARERFAAILRGEGPATGAPMEPEDEAERAMLGAVTGAQDDVPGDGKAPLWIFSYWSESAEGGYDVAVTGEGVVHEAETEGPAMPFAGGRQPIDGWRIDSDEGSEVARDDAGYARAAADPAAMAFTVLMQGSDSPVWLFAVETGPREGRDGGQMVAVDAATGEAIDAEDVVRELIGFSIREAGQDSGTVAGSVAGSFGSDFDVELEGHQALVVLVAVSPPPATDMQVVVTDPAGNEHTDTIGPAVGLDATATIVLDVVPAGAYSVRVSSDVAVAHEWEVSWCTDGEAIVPMGSPACDLLPSSMASSGGRHSGSETLSPAVRWPWA